MSRWIDADAFVADSKWCGLESAEQVLFALDHQPSIDIVRCKDCIHYGRDSERNTYGCNLHSIGMTPSGFCSYGEREDEE